MASRAAYRTTTRRKRVELTLGDYIRRRNGRPAGAPGSLRAMLHRSFGARTFAGFWQHWNPIFGYALGRWVFRPAKRFVPAPAALIVTFVVCGALHDGVTMAVRAAPAFLFTPWFFFLGLGVLVGKGLRIDLGDRPFVVRAATHVGYLAICLLVALIVRREWA